MPYRIHHPEISRRFGLASRLDANPPEQGCGLNDKSARVSDPGVKTVTGKSTPQANNPLVDLIRKGKTPDSPRRLKGLEIPDGFDAAV